MASERAGRAPIRMYATYPYDEEKGAISPRPPGAKQLPDNFRVHNEIGWSRSATNTCPRNYKTPGKLITPEGSLYKFGGDLLSHTVAHAVPSAQEGGRCYFSSGDGILDKEKGRRPYRMYAFNRTTQSRVPYHLDPQG